MSTFVLYSVAAGLAAALACGDSGKDAASAQQPAAPRTPARAAGQSDLCALLTENEAAAILRKPMSPPQRQTNGDCWYMKQGGTDFGDVELILTVLPVQIGSRREFDDLVAEQVEQMNESLKKSGLKAVFEAEAVQGVGGPAYYVDPSLFVLVKDRVLGIAAPRPQAVEIAAKALPRFKP
jgi:hypothetical protein